MQNPIKNGLRQILVLKGIRVAFLMVGLLAFYCCKSQNAVLAQNESQISLRDGVVVDLAKREIYIANTASTVEAIELETGKTVWQSQTSGRPLCISGGRLVAQLDLNDEGNALVFGELDLSENGKVVNQNKVGIPDNIRTSVRNSVDGSFYLTPYEVDDGFVFQWNYTPPLSGDYNAEEERKKQEGYIVYDGTTYKNAEAGNLPRGYNNRSILATKEQEISKENARQFVSKNGQHLLVSTKDIKSGAFRSHTWDIYDLATKQRIGSIPFHLSYAPFVVVGNTLITEQGPYEIFDREAVKKTPLQLIGFSLRDGKEIWTRDILDTVYRGPSPP